jgi:multidrug efflux pump subunit AcrA (membrane-fusion protein)
VNVSGTLAAENEVMVSSQAEGVVSRILADLGDRVGAGQVLAELDREKLQYNLDQQKAALARSLARYGAAEPGRLPPIDQTPDVKRAAAELNQAKRASSAPAS